MPNSSVELASDVLQSDQFQLVALVTRRSLVALVRRRRHLANGKRTGVVEMFRRSGTVLGSTRLQTRVSPPVPRNIPSLVLIQKEDFA